MNNRVLGLRVFLLATLRLLSEGKNVPFSFIESNIEKGIASELYQKYKSEYKECGIDLPSLSDVDEYYKKYNGVIYGDGGKYACSSGNGLQLVIALALNEL